MFSCSRMEEQIDSESILKVLSNGHAIRPSCLVQRVVFTFGLVIKRTRSQGNDVVHGAMRDMVITHPVAGFKRHRKGSRSQSLLLFLGSYPQASSFFMQFAVGK